MGALPALGLALPLALLLWLGAGPLPGRTAFGLQAAGVGAALLALGLVLPWALLAAWLPWAWGVAWLVLAVRGGWRAGVRPAPSGWRRRAPRLAAAGLLLGASALAGLALAGRRPPTGAVVDLASPLGPGRYAVVQGGGKRLLNAHLRTLDPAQPGGRAWRGQSLALDIVALDRWGLRARGWRPAAPAAYAIHGAPVLAPCAGTVIAAEAGQPDQPVPRMDTAQRLGNHVILRCAQADVVLAHLRQGSVRVRPGQAVAVGAPLGAVGNSGASSEPHLHLHAQRAPAPGAPPIAGEPLPVRIGGRFLVRNDRLHGRAPGP